MDVQAIEAKQLLVRVKDSHRWFGVDYNLNLYRGCVHGCIYCDSRSECYHNDPFETIKYKENAIPILVQECQSKPKHQLIAFGSMSDPYNPLEKKLELTKKALDVLNQYQMGALIITKSDLIVRDLEILLAIQQHSPVAVLFTITTDSEPLQKKLEPSVSTTSERLKAIKKISDHGIQCGVLMMPILPFINDTEANVLAIIQRSKEAGASFIYPSFGVTLRDQQRQYFFSMLDREFPGLKNVYMDTFGYRYSAQSIHSSLLKKTFLFECRKQKLLVGMKDIVQFIKPQKQEQLRLF